MTDTTALKIKELLLQVESWVLENGVQQRGSTGSASSMLTLVVGAVSNLLHGLDGYRVSVDGGVTRDVHRRAGAYKDTAQTCLDILNRLLQVSGVHDACLGCLLVFTMLTSGKPTGGPNMVRFGPKWDKSGTF